MFLGAKLKENPWIPTYNTSKAALSGWNDLNHGSCRPAGPTSLNKQAVLFSRPRRLEPSPLTTKTQGPGF